MASWWSWSRHPNNHNFYCKVKYLPKATFLKERQKQSVKVVSNNTSGWYNRESESVRSIRSEVGRVDITCAIPEPPNNEKTGEERDELELIRTQVRGEDEHAWWVEEELLDRVLKHGSTHRQGVWILPLSNRIDNTSVPSWYPNVHDQVHKQCNCRHLPAHSIHQLVSQAVYFRNRKWQVLVAEVYISATATIAEDPYRIAMFGRIEANRFWAVSCMIRKDTTFYDVIAIIQVRVIVYITGCTVQLKVHVTRRFYLQSLLIN